MPWTQRCFTRRCARSGETRLWNADAIDAGFLQLKRRSHRAISADNNQRLDAKFVQDLTSLCDDLCWNDRSIACADLGHEMAAISGADDGASKRHDSFGAVAIKNHMIAWPKKSFESVTKTDHLPTEFLRREHNAA